MVPRKARDASHSVSSSSPGGSSFYLGSVLLALSADRLGGRDDGAKGSCLPFLSAWLSAGFCSTVSLRFKWTPVLCRAVSVRG